MSLWQKAMISLARNGAVTGFMHKNAAASKLASSFVGGANVAQAVRTAQAQKQRGISVSGFFLGEYVDDAATVEAGMQQLLALIPAMAAAGLQLHISVDPTQIGSLQSLELLHANAERLAKALQDADSDQRKVLMIDMEDSSVTELSLELYDSLADKGYPVAITLQTYLHRTPGDLAKVIERGGMVRLVKGAFAEPASIAATKKADIDQRYRDALEQAFLTTAKENGFYPVIASHDKAMIDHAIQLAKTNGWSQHEYEFEMLYGVRSALQRELAGQGYSIRAYLPYGESWFPYAIRRVGENPANALFVLRAMASK